MVTGAARGIGAAIAAGLAGAGATVAVCDLDEAGAVAVADEVAGQSGVKSAGVRLDVADGASVRAAVARVREVLGEVDVLVNNAGIDVIEPFVDSREATWDRLLAVNLKGPIQCAHAVVPGMLERGHGRIVNIASDAGRVGSSGEVVYSAAKGGVIAFTKALARETAAKGVSVNCVCPGPTETALLGQVAEASPKVYAALSRAVPMRRTAVPADIAPAVVFLAGAGAGYITGQTLSVSGGLTMC